MIKLIASDMDGTLLDDNKKINPEFDRVFEELKKRGIIFCAASGRQYYSLLDLFRNKKDDMIFLSENGSYVTERDEELLYDPIPTKYKNELVHYLKHDLELPMIYNAKERLWLENNNHEFVKDVIRYCSSLRFVKDITSVEEEAVKVEFWDGDGIDKYVDEVQREFGDYLNVAPTSHMWCSFMKKDVSKGKAIRVIQKKYGIKPEETMVFGDQMNDYEMMEAAKYSFAMGNAVDEVKKVANYVAKKNSENGVLEAIKDVLKIEI